MVSRHKLKTKDLKGPDQFQSKALGIMDWGSQNWKPLAAVGVVVFLIIAGGLISQWYKQEQRAERSEALGLVHLAYEKELEAHQKAREGIQKQIQELDDKIAEAKKAAPKGAKEKAKKADMEKVDDVATLTNQKKEFEAKLTNLKADHQGSLQQYRDFFGTNQEDPEGWHAGMRAADILLETQEYAEADEMLAKILSASRAANFYQTSAGLLRASVLEELAKFDKALEILHGVEKVVDDELKPKVLLAIGRVHMLKKTNDEAQKTFDRLIEKHSASPEAQKARSLQTLLN